MEWLKSNSLKKITLGLAGVACSFALSVSVANAEIEENSVITDSPYCDPHNAVASSEEVINIKDEYDISPADDIADYTESNQGSEDITKKDLKVAGIGAGIATGAILAIAGIYGISKLGYNKYKAKKSKSSDTSLNTPPT